MVFEFKKMMLRADKKKKLRPDGRQPTNCALSKIIFMLYEDSCLYEQKLLSSICFCHL